MKKLIACATLILGNIVWFYAMKEYNDMRQVRVVSATLPSVVELSAIGPIIERKPFVEFKGKHMKVGYRYKRTGFGPMNRGSGVIVSNDGLILTCNHVTRKGMLMEVYLKGYNIETFPSKGVRKPRKLFAYVVGRDPDADIALIRVLYPGQWFRPVKLRNTLQKGLPVLTIGFPGDFNKQVSAGVISSFVGNYIYTDLAINYGSSGGGVFDVNGELCGLMSFLEEPFSGATRLDLMHKLMEKYEDF